MGLRGEWLGGAKTAQQRAPTVQSRGCLLREHARGHKSILDLNGALGAKPGAGLVLPIVWRGSNSAERSGDRGRGPGQAARLTRMARVVHSTRAAKRKVQMGSAMYQRGSSWRRAAEAWGRGTWMRGGRRN